MIGGLSGMALARIPLNRFYRTVAFWRKFEDDGYSAIGRYLGLIGQYLSLRTRKVANVNKNLLSLGLGAVPSR